MELGVAFYSCRSGPWWRWCTVELGLTIGGLGGGAMGMDAVRVCRRENGTQRCTCEACRVTVSGTSEGVRQRVVVTAGLPGDVSVSIGIVHGWGSATLMATSW